MRPPLLLLATLLLLGVGPALARDRPVTEEERTKLIAAVNAAGCEGGTLEFDDDGHFEVDDARCNDGRRYDLVFDTTFKLIKKELED
jgi:hypothetical protein